MANASFFIMPPFFADDENKAWLMLAIFTKSIVLISSKEGANKRGNSSRLTQSFHFFMFEPIF
ncbi:hypothetical protein, partial [Klebsiella pneumoniae]